MLFEALIIGMIIGFSKEGRLDNFAQIDFRVFYLIILGSICQFVTFFLKDNVYIKDYVNYIIMAGLILTFIFLLFNYKFRGFKLVMLGFVLNIAAYWLNGLKMPILIFKNSENTLINLKFAIEINDIKNYILFDNAHQIFRYLGKFAIMPSWYPFNKYFSIGDMIIALGMIIFIVSNMLSHKRSSFGTRYYR